MDTFDNAQRNAKPDCPRCHGSGLYQDNPLHGTICALCCRHNMGWWQLTALHGVLAGEWCCRAGCGALERQVFEAWRSQQSAPRITGWDVWQAVAGDSADSRRAFDAWLLSVRAENWQEYDAWHAAGQWLS